jgi:hypothetical protein
MRNTRKYNNGFGSELWKWVIDEKGDKFVCRGKGDKDPDWWHIGTFDTEKEAIEACEIYIETMHSGGYCEASDEDLRHMR